MIKYNWSSSRPEPQKSWVGPWKDCHKGLIKHIWSSLRPDSRESCCRPRKEYHGFLDKTLMNEPEAQTRKVFASLTHWDWCVTEKEIPHETSILTDIYIRWLWMYSGIESAQVLILVENHMRSWVWMGSRLDDYERMMRCGPWIQDFGCEWLHPSDFWTTKYRPTKYRPTGLGPQILSLIPQTLALHIWKIAFGI